MKHALFLAALCLVLPAALTAPADAARQVTAKNETPYTVKATITYATALCRNDHPSIAPGDTFRVNIGLCVTQKATFSANGHQCELIGGRPGNPTIFVIMPGRAVGYRDLYCAFKAR